MKKKNGVLIKIILTEWQKLNLKTPKKVKCSLIRQLRFR